MKFSIILYPIVCTNLFLTRQKMVQFVNLKFNILFLKIKEFIIQQKKNKILIPKKAYEVP